MACEQGNHYALGEDKARIQARENISHGLFYGESGIHTCFLARKLNDTICAKNLYSIGIEILPQRAVSDAEKKRCMLPMRFWGIGGKTHRFGTSPRTNVLWQCCAQMGFAH
jgi:hypothetical protein